MQDRIQRTGHDRDPRVARQAEKTGVVDRAVAGLIPAVSKAGLVVLALPANELRETLAAIAPELREGAVVMDTLPVKTAVLAWAAELLPAGRYYIGLLPALNPESLPGSESGLAAARSDLFRNGVMGIVAGNVPPEAIQLATDLANLLGAAPLFFDPAELDGLAAATHLLPLLLSATLVNATASQPGWQDARKLAGRAYTAVTGPLQTQDDPAALRTAALLNPENTQRVLGNAIAELEALREAIAGQDEPALRALLERASQGRADWWAQRRSAGWPDESPPRPAETSTSTEVFGRFIGLGGMKRKLKGQDR
jgi:prephenate dehydrogenase